MSYKVGIVGYGVVGKRRHISLNKIPDFEVTSVSDINFNSENKPHNLNCYYDFRDLIDNEELDVLLISLPNNFAAEATLLGLHKNLNVFCEKPPCKTLDELLPIRDFIKDSKLKLMYGFNHRFHSSVMKAKKIINEKKLGKVINLKGSYGK